MPFLTAPARLFHWMCRLDFKLSVVESESMYCKPTHRTVATTIVSQVLYIRLVLKCASVF